jgi:hypothetical protein
VYYKRRSKAKSDLNDGAPPTGASNAMLEEQHAEGLPGSRHEKDGKPVIAELSTKANTHELGGTRRNAPYELPSNEV